MSKLTPDQVKHVAKLANLPVTDKEIEKYSDQFSKILDYIEQLNQVDTSGVEPTFNVSGQVNVYHQDETIAGISQEEALSNTSQKEKGMFVVKRVLGGEDNG